MQAEVAKRVTDYIDTLKASGAPHQQELANDLSEVMGYYKQPSAPVVDDRDDQIEQLKKNVEQLMDERDAARKEWDASRKELDDTKQLLENATRNFEVRERDLKAELEKKNHGVAKDAPEESHAALKKSTSAKKHS